MPEINHYLAIVSVNGSLVAEKPLECGLLWGGRYSNVGILRSRLGAVGTKQEAIAAMALAGNCLLFVLDHETRPPEFEDAASKLGDLQIENLGEWNPRTLRVEEKGQDFSSLSFLEVRVHRRDLNWEKAEVLADK